MEYEYTVLDKQYRGNRLSFGGVESSSRGVMKRIVERYAPGASVDVYYDPQQPNVAVLERNASALQGPVIGAVAGLVLLLAAILSLLPAGDKLWQQVTIGTKDKVGYRGDATEQDARALGQALKERGYFKDKGAFVYLGKVKDGAFVSFEVEKGAWDNASQVAAFRKLASEIAPVVGSYPLKVELGYEDRGSDESHYQAMTTIVIRGLARE